MDAFEELCVIGLCLSLVVDDSL